MLCNTVVQKKEQDRHQEKQTRGDKMQFGGKGEVDKRQR
jgi:hypothetical protein